MNVTDDDTCKLMERVQSALPFNNIPFRYEATFKQKAKVKQYSLFTQGCGIKIYSMYHKKGCLNGQKAELLVVIL